MSIHSEGDKLRPEGAHPDKHKLEGFARGELPRADLCYVVRHLLTNCPQCGETIRRLWKIRAPTLLDLEDLLEGVTKSTRPTQSRPKAVGSR